MRLTPMEIQQKEFSRGLRGYSTREVRNFLEMVASVYAELVADVNELREQLNRKDHELQEHREREYTLRETILTAQKTADDLRRNAQREAELTVAEASLRADEIVKNAHQRVVQLQGQIQELKRQRAEAECDLVAVLDKHRKILDVQQQVMKRDDAADGKLAFIDRERSSTK